MALLYTPLMRRFILKPCLSSQSRYISGVVNSAGKGSRRLPAGLPYFTCRKRHLHCVCTLHAKKFWPYGLGVAVGLIVAVPSRACDATGAVAWLLSKLTIDADGRGAEANAVACTVDVQQVQTAGIAHRRHMTPSFLSEIFNFLSLSFRLVVVVTLFLPSFLLYPVICLWPGFGLLWWKLFLKTLELSGPVFVKLGQWASTRRDLFSATTCDQLSTLQRKTSPHGWTPTEGILKTDFGNAWQEMFVYFDSSPVGSGCVAQVHKAYIKSKFLPAHIRKNLEQQQCRSDDVLFGSKGHFEDGFGDLTLYQNSSVKQLPDAIPVAVKVLHPQIHRRFQRDITLLSGLTHFAERLFPSFRWLCLTDCVEEFGCFMMNQLDLTNEAKILEKFKANFKDQKSVRFPQPLWPFVTRDVLIETWEAGIPLSHFIHTLPADVPSSPLQETLADLGVSALLKMD